MEKLKEEYPKKHLIVVLDNAPFHKLKLLQLLGGVTLVFLPSYSPQLNPAERFFEELRKATANRIFDTLGAHEKEVAEKVVEYINDTEAVKRLAGYEWIVKQMEGVF